MVVRREADMCWIKHDQRASRRRRTARRRSAGLMPLGRPGRARRVEHEAALGLVGERLGRLIGDRRPRSGPNRSSRAVDHQPHADVGEVGSSARPPARPSAAEVTSDRGAAVARRCSRPPRLEVPVDRRGVQAGPLGRPPAISKYRDVVLEQHRHGVAGGAARRHGTVGEPLDPLVELGVGDLLDPVVDHTRQRVPGKRSALSQMYMSPPHFTVSDIDVRNEYGHDMATDRHSASLCSQGRLAADEMNTDWTPSSP